MSLPLPEMRYARSGDVHIAYHTIGDGPVDLVIFPAFTWRLYAASR